ncbi:5-methyltetrahydrofolate--homocysteine methyltransferase [Catenovulum sediminis]|uniref:5-methyltetrahydrofolate--homocysteine methyltransferase n=2 Tax=Catenovulum sediminis TaxID=1740262 RepID=A0ABV1RE74_9ALTE
MKLYRLNLLAVAISTLLLSACGDSETTIVEKDPIQTDPDDGHDHSDGYLIESAGRLAVSVADSNEVAIYDLDNNQLLQNIAVSFEGGALSYSAGFRYATVTHRGQDQVEFIDGGLWREDHGEHLHDYKQAPALSSYKLMGSRPTHLVKHDGKLAVFYDGNSETGEVSSVEVLSDTDIANQTQSLPAFSYSVNMHGVAEPNGEYVFASIRRDDALSTSANKILPDQVGVFHLHDDEYELDHTFVESCPDLHGAAQNEEVQVFGCSDGVLVTQKDGSEFTSAKIANIDSLDGLRVGTIYGHEHLHSFIGVASQHGGGEALLVQINPEENEMDDIDWQPLTDAHPVSYAFSADAEHFLILDNLGYLTILSAEEHDGHKHWAFDRRVDISQQDVADMPDNHSFSMTVAQNGHFVYIADPIARHVLKLDLESDATSEFELNVLPKAITWLGIAEHEDDHADEHDHDH